LAAQLWFTEADIKTVSGDHTSQDQAVDHTSQDQAVMINTRLSISLLFFLHASWAAPQNDFLQGLSGLLGGAGGLRNIINNPVIQERILRNNLNPCNGVPPATCQCTNGQIIPFSIEYRDNPCSGGARPDQCTCPDGNNFQIRDLAENVIDKYNLPSCGRGVEPSFCTCRDGSTFQPQTVTGPPCGSRGFGGIPSSCTCPGGNTITTNDFISRALPAIQDLLG